jgi:CRISPR-associated protein Cmr4
MSDQSSTNGMSLHGHGAALLFLHAQTGLHPGSGSALGVVDLPIQRERHTQWPLIPGTSLKGVLRDAAREHARASHRVSREKANNEDDQLVTAFGPGKVDESSGHAGALSLTDARILAYPVRSLLGVFAWVTCPDVLERLNRDLQVAGKRPLEGVQELKLGTGQAACDQQSPLLVEGDRLVLEEFDFERVTGADQVAAWLAKHATNGTTSERIRRRLVVLASDDFTHFVRHATEVVARVGLDYERKTVKKGALFYQEFLPPETLFYSLAFAADSRRNGHARRAAEVLAYLKELVQGTPVLQIGGDETTGKGLCLVRLDELKE